ncbi:GDNF family receptor alpha-1b isoform X2 [Scleropages formosus]|uniref:GDNF family receptor alpha-1 n=1 Tax=Scleropages formosus TaxID=113540 RepID=A0A8C9SFM9_SCLFO|nr:GDNF family receptor alpha-1 isoform X2 [Scleropages formosus]
MAVSRRRSYWHIKSVEDFLSDVLLSAQDAPLSPLSPLSRSPGSPRLDCVKASELCLRDPPCSSKYRTLRQCVAGKEGNLSVVSGFEAQDECRSAMEALKQSPLYNCRCRRGMKKEKNCLRIYWGFYQSLQGNDLLEVSPYEPMNTRLSDVFRLAPIISGEPAVTKENNCLNAAKACNLNDTCKKYRSAYISPCTSRVSTAEVCNRRKCHKALRQFFDKVPPKHSYSMLFCSCPTAHQSACTERRRQTIVPVCSYEDREKPNCLSLQESCKTNYICRSRLADFFSNCQVEPRSLSGCLKENYGDCLLAYSGLIGTAMTPNYLRLSHLSVSPWCDCSNSGNSKEECDKFLEFFTDNLCLRSAIQAFGNGTDVGVWQPAPPVLTSTAANSPPQRTKDRSPNDLEVTLLTHRPDTVHNSVYHICRNLQAQKLRSNSTVDTVLCMDDDIVGPGSSNAVSRSAVAPQAEVGTGVLLLSLLVALCCSGC